MLEIPPDLATPLPEAAGDERKKREQVGWKEAAERLDRLRNQGEPFTSERDFAERFRCAPSTIHKAIQNTPSLQPWAKPEAVSAPNAQSLNNLITDNKPQQREPNPGDALDAQDVDAALRYLLEHAGPEERGCIHAMQPDEKRKLAELAYSDPDRGNKILGRKA